MTIGEKIKEVRVSKGLTQKEVGERIGKTSSFIGQYENGARLPKYETLKNIAKALDVSITIFLDVFANKNEYYQEHPDQYPVEYVNELVDCITLERDRFKREQTLKSPIIKNTEENINKIARAMYDLNSYGQFIAVQRVKELTEIPKYQRTAPPAPGEAAPTPPEGKKDQGGGENA